VVGDTIRVRRTRLYLVICIYHGILYYIAQLTIKKMHVLQIVDFNFFIVG